MFDPDYSLILSIANLLIVIIVGLVGYFKFVVTVEHRLTKLESLEKRMSRIENFADSWFNELLEFMDKLLKKVPSISQNPHKDRRKELMEKLKKHKPPDGKRKKEQSKLKNKKKSIKRWKTKNNPISTQKKRNKRE